MSKKYGGAREATGDNMKARYKLDNQGYTHTQTQKL
jgi:hypothetical protein